MKFFVISLFVFFYTSFGFAQNVHIDATTYTPQQLVEDVLIDSGCISNIQVSNTVSGNFPDGDKSFGYFTANNSSFPFTKGIVMSTGKLGNVPGPNTSLSDDDAPNWIGDIDLEAALGISNTTNATIIEFDFIPNSDNIQFRYLFASEEYQEGDPNTCLYSDAFAFLIKPIDGNYTNIALVPNTNTPVLVTTVHSGIPGSCPPINESYFEGWNGQSAPINFNGQTKVLTASTSVTVNQTYHIKLVIADEVNYRYDSTVFLEGGSFNIAANLGPDLSFANGNPLCPGLNYNLDATPVGIIPVGYKWFKNEVIIPGETTAQLTITTPGTYKVAIDYGNGCVATDEILVELSNPVVAQNTELYQCEPIGNGRATFNLFNAETNLINGNQLLRVYSFHRTLLDAQNNQNPIRNPERYRNSRINEIVFARVVSDYGCTGIGEVTLKTTTNTVSSFTLVNCSNEGTPGFASFNLSPITSELISIFGNNTDVSYHPNYEEAILQTNSLQNPFTNTEANTQTIFARINGDLGCKGIAKINLYVVNTPEFEGPETYIYCLNTYPETITINSGLIGTITDAEFSWSTGETTPSIEINETGTYTVTVNRIKIINGQTYSCVESRIINVLQSETAIATYELSGSYGNQTLTVIVEGVGEYLFSLDDGLFQASPTFEKIKPGNHTVIIKDVNGCGEVILKAYVLGFPNYFTPNNDGYHDYWQVLGLDLKNIQVQKVEIFDRFGKNLFVINSSNLSWDGTYKGRPLPSSDYWFKCTFKDGSTYQGHFTLKR